MMNYAIVLCWYAELEKYVDFRSGSLQNLFLQEYHTFHTTW